MDLLTLLEVDVGIAENVLTFCDGPGAISFGNSCKTGLRVYTKLRSTSLDEVRLSYLNEPNGTINRFGRLIDVLEIAHRYPLIKFSGDVGKFEAQLCRRVGPNLAALMDAMLRYNRSAGDGPKFFIAGGSVLATLLGNEEFGDVDVFMMENGNSPATSHAILRDLLMSMDDNQYEYGVVKSSGAMSILSEDRRRPVQVIFRRVSCMEELLCLFDLDSCRFGFDGEKVYSTSEGLRSLELSENFCDFQHFYKTLYYRRAVKYAKRGFETRFVSVHPLEHLFTPRQFRQAVTRKLEYLQVTVYDELDGEHEAGFALNMTNDCADRVDVGLYSSFADISMTELKDLVSVGVDVYFEIPDEDMDEGMWQFDRGGGTGAERDLPLKYRFPLDEAKSVAKQHVFGLSFKDLYFQDRTIFFREWYFESHLYAKYDIARCYMTGRWFKIHRTIQHLMQMKGKWRDIETYYPLQTREQICAEGHVVNARGRDAMFNKDLKGRVAIVTGARVKIGYECALHLLLAGATVIATTRFIADAQERFKKHPDYPRFSSQLILYPLNMKNKDDVLTFVDFVKERFPERIHIIINNAAQTVRKPLHLYESLLGKEYRSLAEQLNKDYYGEMDEDESHYKELRYAKGQFAFTSRNMNKDRGDDAQNFEQLMRLDKSLECHKNVMNMVLPTPRQMEAFGQVDWANVPEEVTLRMRSVANLFNNLHPDDINNPMTRHRNMVLTFDEYGEQIPPRRYTHFKNSWHLQPDEIDPVELFEVQMVNHLSPTIMLSELSGLLCPGSDPIPSYVINVTSIEGSFAKANKESNHIHTNMSKAALNMLTRSGAEFYAKRGILLNSVDTGWISSSVVTWKRPPLEPIDGAARVLHPIMTDSLEYGKLYKNYKVLKFW